MNKNAILYILALFVLGLPAKASELSANAPLSAEFMVMDELDTDIPEETLSMILTQAAPVFGFSPEQFISMYYRCNCIAVSVIGPNNYRVEYGGLGIEILVDVSSVVEVQEVLHFFQPKRYIRE